jgi:hypothetical protein
LISLCPELHSSCHTTLHFAITFKFLDAKILIHTWIRWNSLDDELNWQAYRWNQFKFFSHEIIQNVNYVRLFSDRPWICQRDKRYGARVDEYGGG